MAGATRDSSTSWATAEGLPYPLGVSWSASEQAFNFALYSKHATSVHLLLFAESDLARPRLDLTLDPMIH
jgi:glycogen operon protein